jgi:hypothetical protein
MSWRVWDALDRISPDIVLFLLPALELQLVRFGGEQGRASRTFADR